MTQLKAIVTSGLITLLLSLFVSGSAFIADDTQPVQADASAQITAITADDNIYYLPLTDAPPHRDVSLQQFASQ